MKTTLAIIVIMLIPFLFNTKDHLVIRGQVSDRETHEALTDCHVYINDKSAGTITDANGKFKLRVPSECRNKILYISHIGYGKYMGKAQRISDKQLNIRLNPEPIWLDALTIRPDDSADEQTVAAALSPVNN